MNATDLLVMDQITLKQLRKNIFKIVVGKKPYVVTRKNKRVAVLVPYNKMVDMVERQYLREKGTR